MAWGADKMPRVRCMCFGHYCFCLSGAFFIIIANFCYYLMNFIEVFELSKDSTISPALVPLCQPSNCQQYSVT